MTATDFSALTTAQKKVWSAELWMAGRDESFWMSNGFVGKSDSDMNSPIYRVTKLTQTDRGLECVMQLVSDLANDGVAGDNLLEGNEGVLNNEAQTIRIDQLRNGVRSKGRIAEQATVIRFRATAKERLSFWMADKMDEMLFLVAAGRAFTLNTNGSTRGASDLPSLSYAADVVAASTNRIIHAGTATTEGSLTANDKMSWATIVRARAFAERKKIRPIRGNGKGYYAMVMSSEQAKDLILDPTYPTIVSRAGEKGPNNPLFKNAMAVVQGVVLYSHNKVFNTLGTATKWGAGNLVDGAQACMFGAQAMGFATIGDVYMDESDNTDYKNRPGIAAGRMLGMLKPQYKSPADSNTVEDFGMLSVKTAATS